MSDMPDFMREFDTNTDYGFTPVSKPRINQEPSVGKEDLNTTNLEISKVKKAMCHQLKTMMNEIMQIVSEKETVNKEIQDADVKSVLKIEKVVLPFLYNLSKSNEPYIHWPNRVQS